MPEIISREKLRRKVLDRWENEGGKVIAADTPKRSLEQHLQPAADGSAIQAPGAAGHEEYPEPGLV